MHRLSLDVLGQRGFRRIVQWHDPAGDRLVAGNGLRLGEFSQRLQAAAAGLHRIASLVSFRDDQVLQEAMRRDGRGEFINAHRRLGLADIALSRNQLRQSDHGDVGHCISPSPAREEPRRAMLALHAGMRGQGRRAQRPLTARSRAACDKKWPGAVRGVIADAKRLRLGPRQQVPNNARQNCRLYRRSGILDHGGAGIPTKLAMCVRRCPLFAAEV